ncbi:1516_t:CDS:2 [Rhizophagus irregularis]|nr:1516_t:CDS:2 [Rhizophagus irregularis]
MNLMKNLLIYSIYSIALIFVFVQFGSSLPVETPQCLDIKNPLKMSEAKAVPCPYMMNEHKIPTILIIGAGPGGLTLAHSIQKNLNSFEKKFNIKIFDREISPNGVKSLFNCIPESISSRLHEVVLDNKLEHQEHHSSCLYDHKGNVLFKTPGYQVKNIYEFNKLNNMFTLIVTFRDRLRDLLLEGIDVKWGKKCIGYHEDDDNVWAIFDDGTRERGDLLIGADGIHSPIRKQKIPELKINHLGITQCCADITPNKELMDRMLSITGNSLCQVTMGPKGDCTFLMFQNHEKNDNWTYKDDELPTSKFPDDENPEFVFNDIKKRIKENRPKGKLTDIFLEFWDLAKSRIENDHENCYPLRRRPLRDIDPGSVDQWETTRVTLLGDAIHAMNPWVGIDAELLTNALANWSKDNWKEHIRNYELGLRGRGSFYIDLTRTSCIKKHQICDENVILLTKTIKSWWYERMRTWYGDRKERGMMRQKIQIMGRTSHDGKERANVNKKITNYEYGDGKERDDISKK